MKECPVCENPQCELGPGGRLGFPIHDCPRCGTYVVVGYADHSLPALLSHKRINRSVLSHLIRKAQRPGEPLAIFDEDMAGYQDAPPLPRPREQLNNLVLWIGENQGSTATWATSRTEALAATVGTEISAGEGALLWLLSEVKNENLFITHPNNSSRQTSLQLTMKGWSRFEELRHLAAASRTAFMAMQFGDGELQSVLDSCFKPAVARAGFELRPLNEKQPAGLIDNQIRAAIRSARFVIADLTHDNNGAYFEAGFAEGIGLPVLYTCKKDKFEARRTHFDTNHMVTIPWDVSQLEDAGNRLTATVRATLPAEADPGR
jgi:hypothetical protein